MSGSHGRFVWYELMTTDTAAAKAFYGKVVGWGAESAPPPNAARYTLFTAGETPVGGLMDQPEASRKMGAPPSWIGYVAVDDVDAAAERVKHLGGKVYVAPADIPTVGRFAVAADPQGAVLALFKPASPAPEASPAAGGGPGHTGWNELAAADWQKAFDFYGALFGWKKGEAVDIGAMGTYQLFTAGGPPVGGMFNKPPAVPMPYWLYYFNVGDIDAAAGRVKAGGGQVLNGPMQVPGGDWILQAQDPQGAMFALVGKKG